MSRWHDELKEQCVLLALGLTPDLPVMEIVDHLRDCPQCHRLMQETHELAGRLPESLQVIQPPPVVRTRILAHIRGTLGRETFEQKMSAHDKKSQGLERGAIAIEQPHQNDLHTFRPNAPVAKRNRQSARPWARSVALTAAMLLLLFGNGALYFRTTSQQHDLNSLEAQYAADRNWLRSAEYLLVSGEPPAYQAVLSDPDSQATDINQHRGKAALYQTAQYRTYLLIQAEGLSQNTAYSVWLNHDGESWRLGEFDATSLGTGSYVYAVDTSDWFVTTPTHAVIGIRDEQTQQTMLTGPLVPAIPNH